MSKLLGYLYPRRVESARGELISKAEGVMLAAHFGQTRKYTGEPYSNHPMAVAVMLMGAGYPDLAPAALLHDVVEDTPLTLHFIESHFGYEITSLVQQLTNVYTKENYPKLNREQRFQLELGRLSNITAEAQTIKYVDLIDNTKSIVDNDPDFALVYLSEKVRVLNKLTKGDLTLWSRAFSIATEGLRRLGDAEDRTTQGS